MDIKNEWSPKNNINIEDDKTRFKYIWICEFGHEWLATLGKTIAHISLPKK
jgi:hypothetical protein